MLDYALEVVSNRLVNVINGTGVVVHTNLGRSLIAEEIAENIKNISCGYSNLEFNLKTGKRGLRYNAIEDIICEISGAEAALAVNNNAGAVLLALDTIARNREVVVSRGELVEIGGSFRVPDVMEKSGGILVEVGTTNRTHQKDYVNAINEKTGLLLKVHTSNYSVVGFTKSVSLSELVDTGKKHQVPVMEDLGSGTFVDFSRYGLTGEPTVQESVKAGLDIITFSGDKLLGGPQAGIIVGKKKFVDQIKQNPLTRALRIDKMTLAALESTLKLYLDEKKAVSTIPTLRMLTMPISMIETNALKFKSMIDQLGDNRIKANIQDLTSKAGGGSLPLLELPSKCVGISIQNQSANRIVTFLRNQNPAVIGRIENDCFYIDPRTVRDHEYSLIMASLKKLLEKK